LIAQGYEVKAAVIFQDNQSSMAIIERGHSNSERTRHINIRYFWIKDRADAGELTIKYLNTKEMVADILTKPLACELFKMLLAALVERMNEYKDRKKRSGKRSLKIRGAARVCQESRVPGSTALRTRIRTRSEGATLVCSR
jgi:hypothetical protein